MPPTANGDGVAIEGFIFLLYLCDAGSNSCIVRLTYSGDWHTSLMSTSSASTFGSSCRLS